MPLPPAACCPAVLAYTSPKRVSPAPVRLVPAPAVLPPVFPTGRLSDPEEIAGMAAYLLSEYSENTTGQVIVIDGGSTAVGY